MEQATLRADCARCAALCCVALAFDRSEHFAADKEAGVACPNLEGHRCGIHARLDQEGFGGCARYDCGGAGQRVVQEIFGGRSWRDQPSLLAPMLHAFRVMRQAHERLSLLEAARGLSLAPPQARRRQELAAALDPPQGWSYGALMELERGPIWGEIEAFFASLRGAAASRRGLPLLRGSR